MKVRQFTKFNFSNSLKSMAFFYAVYIAALIAGNIILSMFTNIGTITSSISTWIFLFVIGIVNSHYNMRIGLANSVSRKSIIAASMLCALLLSLVATVLNFVSGEIFYRTTENAIRLNILTEIHPEFFAQHSGKLSYVAAHLVSGLSDSVLSYLAGWFIGSAYYRMRRSAKIVVSVGVPMLLFFGLPVAVSTIPVVENVYYTALATLTHFMARSPYHSALSLMVGSVVLAFFSWLLLRRAPVKTTQA